MTTAQFIMDDRDVDIKGDHLKGRSIDFVVAGGIACIESPRIIRELRRYGARVRVWMTRSATEFVSPRVFEWASKDSVITDLSGAAEHITHADAIVIAPATLDLIAKISLGLADSPALTMIQSALARKSIFAVASMHESLAENPILRSHLATLSKISKFKFIESVAAESKLKMPPAEHFVAEVSHSLSKSALKNRAIAISVGPTRSYADDE
jgi:phosphopantothenoylcysteine decarboxylase/phosphopantothenate--cysteine ligase